MTPDDDLLRELQRDLHELAIKLAAEVERRQAEGSSTRDALNDIRSAVDRLGDEVQKALDLGYANARSHHRLEGEHGSLQGEVTQHKAESREEHGLLHRRISEGDAGLRDRIDNVAKEGRTDVEKAEDRMQVFLHRWLPIIITGLLAAAGGAGVGVRLANGG